MKIHVVKSGETLESIAQQYGITPALIITVNELPNPENLVVGQGLAIRIPERVHTVVQGDTLTTVAETYGVSITEILQNNSRIALTGTLVPGETIIISYQEEESIDTIIINGYAYPFIDRAVLRKTLPYLTYLSIFTYGFTPEGKLNPIEDEELIAIAYEYGVIPVMMLAPMSEEGVFSSDIANKLFANEESMNILIENIVANMQRKGYQGLDIDFEYILPEDKENFINFIRKVQTRLSQEGFITFVALAPKTSGEMVGLLYQAHDYPQIGAIADQVLLMTYEWGYLYGPPMATSPINNMRLVLQYGVSVIDSNKILLGIPNYAYDWPLPYIRNKTQAEAISNQEAIVRAAQYNVTILYDELAQSPYYYYTDYNGVIHVVWFDDVRSMNAKMRLIPELGLDGAGVWQIMNFFPGLWNVVGAYFTVEKQGA